MKVNRKKNEGIVGNILVCLDTGYNWTNIVSLELLWCTHILRFLFALRIYQLSKGTGILQGWKLH